MNEDTLFDIDNALRFGLGYDDLADAVASSLDAAWAEAEAALPEGWVLQGITPSRAEWEALASSWTARAGDKQDWQAGAGPTPAAALRALAAKLLEAMG